MELIEMQENSLGERIPSYIEIDPEEDWRFVKDFPKYIVTDHGRIINIKSGKVLKPIKMNTNQHGNYVRYVVSLYSDTNQFKRCLVHQIVAKAFLPIPELNPDGSEFTTGICVNHKDGNTSNNNVYNLEWCDVSYNSRIERQSYKPSKYGLSIFMSLEELLEKRKEFEYRSSEYNVASTMITRKRKALKK